MRIRRRADVYLPFLFLFVSTSGLALACGSPAETAETDASMVDAPPQATGQIPDAGAPESAPSESGGGEAGGGEEAGPVDGGSADSSVRLDGANIITLPGLCMRGAGQLDGYDASAFGAFDAGLHSGMNIVGCLNPPAASTATEVGEGSSATISLSIACCSGQECSTSGPIECFVPNGQPCDGGQQTLCEPASVCSPSSGRCEALTCIGPFGAATASGACCPCCSPGATCELSARSHAESAATHPGSCRTTPRRLVVPGQPPSFGQCP